MRAPHTKGMLILQEFLEAEPVRTGVFGGTRAPNIIPPLKGLWVGSGSGVGVGGNSRRGGVGGGGGAIGETEE